MNTNGLRISIVVSLLLHAVLAAVVWFQPSFLIPSPKTKTPERVEVDIVDAEAMLKKIEQLKKDQGQIVTQETRVNDEIDEKTKFLSKHNQKVEKQTQAALNGQFRNSTDGGGNPAPKVKQGESDQKTQDKNLAQNEKKPEQNPSEKTGDEVKDQAHELKADELLTENNGIKNPLALNNLKPSFRPRPKPLGSEAAGGGEGPSATDDHLKDVKTGMQTMLSTREFVYYSYYNRIKGRLSQYWEPKIKEKMERIMRQGRTIASDFDRVTKVVIILDKNGTLVRVQVLGPSGLTDLDDAAIEAFRAAAPFPNPPTGIVGKDGLIRIRWDFILEANASKLRFRNVALLK